MVNPVVAGSNPVGLALSTDGASGCHPLPVCAKHVPAKGISVGPHPGTYQLIAVIFCQLLPLKAVCVVTYMVILFGAFLCAWDGRLGTISGQTKFFRDTPVGICPPCGE